MAAVRLTGACIDFLDRTRPIIDGRAQVPDLALDCVALPPRVLDERFVDYDLAEVALTTYLVLRSDGDEQFVALPIFPYRSFFLSNVIVNVESGIASIDDLAGRRIGTGGLHLAGTMWTRGMLEELSGIDTRAFRWYTRSSDPGSVRSRLVALSQGTDTSVEVVAPDRSISDMLESGELDGWVGSSPPECFTPESTKVRRLLPHYRSIEEDYARRTGILPIIHVIVVRRDLYQRHPWIARRLIELFMVARTLGLRALENNGLFACGLPWLRHDLEQLPTTFGGDPYAYGLEPNRKALRVFLQHAVRQGLCAAPLTVDELFPAEMVA